MFDLVGELRRSSLDCGGGEKTHPKIKNNAWTIRVDYKAKENCFSFWYSADL